MLPPPGDMFNRRMGRLRTRTMRVHGRGGSGGNPGGDPGEPPGPGPGETVAGHMGTEDAMPGETFQMGELI